MKSTIYIEIEFKDKQTFQEEFKLKNSSKYYYYNSAERILNDKELQEIIFEIYNDLLIKYPTCAKIKNMMFTFVGNDNFFIYTIIFTKINRRTKKYKIELVDWKGRDIHLKYSDSEEGEET